MPTITPADVARMAALGRIALTAKETEAATKDLAGILDHFATIQHVDTNNIPPADDVTGLSNITRVDEAQPEAICPTEALLAAAPAVKDSHVKVKAVL